MAKNRIHSQKPPQPSANISTPWKTRLLPNSRILLALKTGNLTPALVSAIIKSPHPEFYALLWDLSWKTGHGCDQASIQRALTRCYWDDSRSTEELIQVAQRIHEGTPEQAPLKILQRRGGFEVFQLASELTKNKNQAQSLLGIQILRQLEGPWCPLKKWIFRTLLRSLAEKPIPVVSASLEALLEWSTLNLTEIVTQFINHENSELRTESNELLKGIKAPQSHEGLLRLVSEGNAPLRQAILRALRELLLPEETVETDLAPQKQRVQIGTKEPTRRGKKKGSKLASRKRRGILVICGIIVLAYPTTQLAQSLLLTAHPLGWVSTPTSLETSNDLPASRDSFNETELEALVLGDDIQGDNLMMASRINRWIKLKNRPTRQLLNNSSETWTIYHSMNVQLGAYLVSRAFVPDPKSKEERLDFRHLIRSIVMDINNGFHGHAAEFLQHLTQFNSELSSYLLLESSDKAIQLFFDDFVVQLSALTIENSGLGGIQDGVSYHSSLNKLTRKARTVLAGKLDSGWVTAQEQSLAEYLRSF